MARRWRGLSFARRSLLLCTLSSLPGYPEWRPSEDPPPTHPVPAAPTSSKRSRRREPLSLLSAHRAARRRHLRLLTLPKAVVDRVKRERHAHEVERGDDGHQHLDAARVAHALCGNHNRANDTATPHDRTATARVARRGGSSSQSGLLAIRTTEGGASPPTWRPAAGSRLPRRPAAGGRRASSLTRPPRWSHYNGSSTDGP